MMAIKGARLVALAATAITACTFTAPALAHSSAADYFRARTTSSNVPELLSRSDRTYYQKLFHAIDQRDWSQVEAMLAERADGPLHDVARAEYYLHPASPRIEGEAIGSWLRTGAMLPQAEQLVSLGQKRGVAMIPALPIERNFIRQPHAPKRIRPRSIDDGTMPGSIRRSILARISDDDPDGARQLLDGIDASLSSSARAEWRQRVAWSYYIENHDAQSYALALTARDGGSGAWVAEADWTAGLAAWRMGDCDAAAENFSRAARGAHNAELAAAAFYWSSRANIRCRYPEKAAEELRGAAQLDETLYGMLAREQLGQELPRAGQTPDFDMTDWSRLREEPNVRAAVALAEIGEDRLADEILRHQARIGDPSDYDSLSRLARELGLPSTQLWMAHNAPRGGQADPALRYPAPRWTPVNGWKVDPALAYAHTLQESVFRANVVSPAGARGLMQIMPAAAKDHSRELGYTGNASDLNKPAVNLAFGQSHLQMLRDSSATGGLLPKIMAAYNAGLSPISRWNTEVKDQGDPLLYMESIPYWETRGYVAIVMRNYWMYERQAGGASESRKALVQGMWPTFPELSGANAVRLTRAD